MNLEDVDASAQSLMDSLDSDKNGEIALWEVSVFHVNENRVWRLHEF